MQNVVDKIKVLDKYCLFTMPVTNDMAPRYKSIIEKPMCLELMTDKIAAKQYSLSDCVNELYNDFGLLVRNAAVFNSTNTVVWKEAWKMLEACKPVFERAFSEFSRVPGNYIKELQR